MAVLAVAITLWLLLTRTGRLALAATRIGLASLPQRWGASSVIVIGIAGVVGVLVAMLAMGQGAPGHASTATDNTAIILRSRRGQLGDHRDQVPLLETLPGVKRGEDGRPLVSAEVSQVVNLTSRGDGTDVNAQFRGVGEQAWAVHDKLKLVEGRKFGAGLHVGDRHRPWGAAVPGSGGWQGVDAGQSSLDGGRYLRIRRCA